MKGQKGGSFWARNMAWHHSFSVTQQVDNRDIIAEIALGGILVFDEIHRSTAWIAQIVSDSGVEDFDMVHGPREIARRNVTSVTFEILVYQSETGARWMINYWS